MMPEFSRTLQAHEIGSTAHAVTLTATPAERVALARRFDLIELTQLEAALSASGEIGGVRVTGRLRARGFQRCGLTAEPVNFTIDEAVDLRFSQVVDVDADEVELSDADLDTLPMDGDTVDLGEAVAQSLGLAIDPYARAPGAALPPQVVPEDQVVALKRPNPFGILKGD